MANVNVNLSLGNNAFTKAKGYNQVFENTQEVDNTDGFIKSLTLSKFPLTKLSSTILKKVLDPMRKSSMSKELSTSLIFIVFSSLTIKKFLQL